MASFAELSESELSTIPEEQEAESTKKATKVTLNIFQGYLLKLANACMSNLLLCLRHRQITEQLTIDKYIFSYWMFWCTISLYIFTSSAVF